MNLKSSVGILSGIFFAMSSSGEFSTSFDNLNNAGSFLPENDLHLEDNNMSTLGQDMTEEEFTQALTEVSEEYEEAFEKNGLSYRLQLRWSNNTVNATASQRWGRAYVTMYGGLARRPEITLDAVVLVLCHELGHHFGGYPLYPDSRWASNEGMSDYFSTHVCVPNAWKNDLAKNAEAEKTVHPVAKSKCDAAWESIEERHVCYRIANAGESVANLFAALKPERGAANYSTPSTDVVSETYHSHPQSQCRLDTYLAGALCSVTPQDLSYIPGKDEENSRRMREAALKSAEFNCTEYNGDVVGFRPRCWYKPILSAE